MAINKNEAAYVVGFLNELEGYFGSAKCNDMYLKDTPENRKMYLAAEELQRSVDKEYESQVIEEALQVPYGSKEKKIGTSDVTILNYLRKRLMDEFNLTDKEIPDTANW
jgi:hypothetical protein